MSELPRKLQVIVEDFSLLEGQEKLEYLLELAERLPPLPVWLLARRDSLDGAHECRTAGVGSAEQQSDGHIRFYLDVPPEGPTVRG